jgi:SsrA-binding protein
VSASSDIVIENRKARFEYEIIDTLVAGMVLKGTEIKSIRLGKVNIADSYCAFTSKHLVVRNLHISEYQQASFYHHPPLRERYLLLQRSELDKWRKALQNKGLTIVPLKLFIAETGYAKLVIALARGKKQHDKRDSIKKRDTERQIQRKL